MADFPDEAIFEKTGLIWGQGVHDGSMRTFSEERRESLAAISLGSLRK